MVPNSESHRHARHLHLFLTCLFSASPPNLVCDTAQWNSSFSILAGSTSSPSSAMNRLNSPFQVAFDGYGRLFVVDYANHRIQMFAPGSSSTTNAVTVAGFNSVGGPGLSELDNPAAMCVDTNGTMYILDTDNYRVMKWLRGEPLGFPVAGNRGSGTTLDKIGVSYALFLDDQSDLYISEYGNHRVTRWRHGNTTAGEQVSVV